MFSFRQIRFYNFLYALLKRKVRKKETRSECDIYCAPEHNKIVDFIWKGKISLIAGQMRWARSEEEEKQEEGIALSSLLCGCIQGATGGYSAFKWMPQIYIKSINHGICRTANAILHVASSWRNLLRDFININLVVAAAVAAAVATASSASAD